IADREDLQIAFFALLTHSTPDGCEDRGHVRSGERRTGLVTFERIRQGGPNVDARCRNIDVFAVIGVDVAAHGRHRHNVGVRRRIARWRPGPPLPAAATNMTPLLLVSAMASCRSLSSGPERLMLTTSTLERPTNRSP